MEKTIITRDHEGKLIVHTKNFYTCFIIYDYLINKVNDFYIVLNGQKIKSMLPINFCKLINENLYLKVIKESDEKKIILFKQYIENKLKELQQYYEKYHFNKIDFSWLKNNKMACMDLWYKLRTIYQNHIILPAFTDNPTNQDGKSIDWLPKHKRYITQYRKYIDIVICYFFENQIQNPTSHKERLDSIQLMFNYLAYHETTRIRIDTFYKCYAFDLTNINLEYFYPNDLIECYKKDWIKIYNSKNTLNWINKSNEEQCRWIWEFLQKEHSITILQHKKNYRLNQNFCFNFFEFTNNEERYLAIFTAIYTAPKDGITDKLLKTMKKLWLQKERRSSNRAKNNKILKKQCKRITKDTAENNENDLNKIV
ncbi:MAG: hypothetical protein J6574_02490 [Gilliamella sp.]|uniref:hypothetical protein n=1 Tax=Gilliamella sp. BG2 TaxID=3351509 RepID=UPI003985E5B4|nr:hypothetical protein [Gilliamella sp.]